MKETPARLILNANLLSNASPKHEQAVRIPSDDPFIELILDNDGAHHAEARKVPRQAHRLRNIRPAISESEPFGSSLDWAYRCYQVVQPQNSGVFRDYLYLFNVLVALEWQPDQAYLEQLKTAFHRASDFLFDVTDGWMAFGQVVFGGPELMEAADIQIVASTRMHPRSWVGGMHPYDEYQNDEKYMPIRLGRGLWNDNRRGVIPWSEPEGYRIIVHEWCHHALKLTDEYLEMREVQLANPGSDPVTVVTLKIATTTDSILATTEGTSELLTDQWQKLSTLYSRIPATHTISDVRAGPDRFPAALPRFRSLAGQGNLISGASHIRRHVMFARNNAASTSPGLSIDQLSLPSTVPLDRCWVYVLKDITATHPRVVAQGTLELRTAVAPFPLLGAEPGDTVLLVADQRDQAPLVLTSTVPATGELTWQSATLPILPVINVIPEPIQPNEPRAQLRVHLTYPDQPTTAQLPHQVYVFPLGQLPNYQVTPLTGVQDASWISDALDVPTLDGHVLLRWEDGSVFITSFSQGGDGPNSSSPFPANPMNAGSANGEALLFMMKNSSTDQAPNDVKVVTTIATGLAGAPTNGHARSYAFSIAANRNLLSEFHPTLIMYYDQIDDQDDPAISSSGTVVICRRAADGSWTPLPTYLPPRFRFAIAPLDNDTAGALIDPNASTLRVECYKVCWIPNS